MVRNSPPEYTYYSDEDSRLTRVEFNARLGLILRNREGEEPSERDIAPFTDIESTAGIEAISLIHLSANIIKDSLALSPIFQNPSPSYDQARGMTYNIFIKYINLHTELLALLHTGKGQTENKSDKIH